MGRRTNAAWFIIAGAAWGVAASPDSALAYCAHAAQSEEQPKEGAAKRAAVARDRLVALAKTKPNPATTAEIGAFLRSCAGLDPAIVRPSLMKFAVGAAAWEGSDLSFEALDVLCESFAARSDIEKLALDPKNSAALRACAVEVLARVPSRDFLRKIAAALERSPKAARLRAAVFQYRQVLQTAEGLAKLEFQARVHAAIRLALTAQSPLARLERQFGRRGSVLWALRSLYSWSADKPNKVAEAAVALPMQAGESPEVHRGQLIWLKGQLAPACRAVLERELAAGASKKQGE